MYVLVLIFLSVGGDPNTSKGALYYPSKDACAVAGTEMASYEAGREAAAAEIKGGKPDQVFWFCLAVTAAVPTTEPDGPDDREFERRERFERDMDRIDLDEILGDEQGDALRQMGDYYSHFFDRI